MCLPETALLVEDHGEGVERWGMVTREGRVQKVMIHSGQAFRILERDVGLPEVTPA